jgi:hypothetical protein
VGGASALGFSAWREPPPAALFERVGLPRKRERRSEPGQSWSIPYAIALPAPECRLAGELDARRPIYAGAILGKRI